MCVVFLETHSAKKGSEMRGLPAARRVEWKYSSSAFRGYLGGPERPSIRQIAIVAARYVRPSTTWWFRWLLGLTHAASGVAGYVRGFF